MCGLAGGGGTGGTGAGAGSAGSSEILLEASDDAYLVETQPNAVYDNGCSSSTTTPRPSARASSCFDLAPVPADAIVSAASLCLDFQGSANTAAPQRLVQARRLLQSWDQAEVTWASASSGVPWQTTSFDASPGGTFAATVTDEVDIDPEALVGSPTAGT